MINPAGYLASGSKGQGLIGSLSAPLTTTWKEQQVRDLIADENLIYQRIELPYGLATRGKDRSDTCRRIFPDDMAGKSVLDVGAHSGYFCFEAVKRGATRVVGVEMEPKHIRAARRVAECLNMPVEFYQLDIEHQVPQVPAGGFDYVICLNVLHHFTDPIAVLRKLADLTRDRLILEFVGFGRHDRKKLNLSWLSSLWLRRMPLLYAGPTGTNGRYYSPKFVLTHRALQNILTCHRNTFTHVEHLRSDFKDRCLAVAHKRRVERLIVVAGLPGVGKSTLIRHLRSDAGREIAQPLGLDRIRDWPHSEAHRLAEKIRQARLDLLVLHYSILSPYHHGSNEYEKDEFLDVLHLAGRITFVTLWAEPDVLRTQFEQAKILACTRKGRFTGQARNKRLLEQFENPQIIVDYYRRWFEFTMSRGANHAVVRDGEGYRLMSIDQWQQMIDQQGYAAPPSSQGPDTTGVQPGVESI